VKEISLKKNLHIRRQILKLGFIIYQKVLDDDIQKLLDKIYSIVNIIYYSLFKHFLLSCLIALLQYS